VQVTTKNQNILRPIGFVFFLDRLLPNYKIIDANYDISTYFKRIPASETAGQSSDIPKVRRALFFDVPVKPILDEKEKARIEKLLLILRLLGVVFTVFLAAAIGALVVH
jgi:hypothetical protein